uniref:Macroglobulin complement-related 2 n=1 Tax=Ixodes ricinus TaxID=34613 RepID=A0A147BL63_IXORI|nr:macroglobulin complement-related 2 [Ixodes ricinus]
MPAVVALLVVGLLSLSSAQYAGYTDNRIDSGPIHHQQPTHLIVASRLVRPGQTYQVVVTMLQIQEPVTVLASIQRNGVEVTQNVRECKAPVPEVILLKVPPSSIPGSYRLRVEGNINGVLGGTAFSYDTQLDFSQRSMTIFIQTDRPLYMQDQTVQFRALPITTELKPFSDAIDVYMLNPNRTIVRRWLSRRTNLGAVSLEYPLSLQPAFGKWTIQVIAQGQVEEKSFIVEEYYQTRFEVNVTLPSFFMATHEYIHGSVEANFTSGAAVTGNLTLRATVEPIKPTYKIYRGTSRYIEKVYRYFEGVLDFHFSLRELGRLVSRLDGMKVVVTAYVGERFLDLIETGFSESVVFNSSLQLRFLGSSPQVFRPGMPFKAYVSVAYSDGSPLPAEYFRNKRVEDMLRVTQSVTYVSGGAGGGQMLNPVPTPVSGSLGIWEVVLESTPSSSDSSSVNAVRAIRLEADFYDANYGQVRASLVAYSSYSPTNHHIQVMTSTKNPKVGEYIIFHVRSNYYVECFSYIVISKGIILLSGQEKMTSSIKTFAVTLSPEMAPTSTVIIYDLAHGNEIVADSLTFPVDGISRDKFNMTLNNRKDKTGDTIEVAIYGDPGTYVALSAVDRTLYNMQAGTEISYSEVLRKMNSFDSVINGTLTQEWFSREGNDYSFVCFPSPTYGLDSNRTFEFAGLMVFSDGNITRMRDDCNITAGYGTCYDGSCFRMERRCDGQFDCEDGSDEARCEAEREFNIPQFEMYRMNRFQRLYTNAWLWKDINIGPLGRYIFNVPVPDIPTQWMLSAYGMGESSGFGILSNSISFSSAKPFYMNVEMPTKIRLGEQLGIRVTVFNYRVYETEVLITLASSPDYKFVSVGALGRVNSYAPETFFGEHQHLIFIKPGKSAVVYMPIVAMRIGTINVTVLSKTQIAKDMVTRSILVEPDGIPQARHTSLLLDLTQGAYLIKYLDTNITETPILPFRQDRLYIFGSNKATLSIVGDVVGPAFPTMPVNATSLLSKPFYCGEQNMFSFAANLYTLLYLRLTNQRDVSIEKQAFKYLNLGYQRQLSYQNDDGSFSVFRWHSQPSVWLTSFCARVFHKATFQEWEHFLYIDPTIIQKAIGWLLDRQSPEGSFHETSFFAYDRKMSASSENPDDPVRFRNVSLTAHVLITLAEVRDIRGEIGSRAATARRSAARYLERMLHDIEKLEDPYELAIVAYALTLVNSVEGETAFNRLSEKLRETSGMRYWSRSDLPAPPVLIENNRPYLYPRLPFTNDASNVETTSYGLLVHVARQAVVQKEIVEWLNTQRLSHGAWASTQDTLMAMQALTEFSVQSRSRDVTDITVTVEAPSTPGFTRQLHIGRDNLSKLQTLSIPNAWGVIIVRAQGSGLAIVQLHVEYNVDTWRHLVTQPPVPAFALNIRQNSYGRNSSHVAFRSCQSWIRTEESPRSGMAVLEVNLPSGYYIQQQTLDAYVQSSNVRNLREARYQEKKVEIYFDYLDTSPICVNFTAQRWYPVANMTRFISIRVYDYYAPERFNETMFELYNLYALSICHVCGSYQCPYCPVFSAGRSHFQLIEQRVLLFCVAFLTLLHRYLPSG